MYYRGMLLDFGFHYIEYLVTGNLYPYGVYIYIRVYRYIIHTYTRKVTIPETRFNGLSPGTDLQVYILRDLSTANNNLDHTS